ncbi:hypothetical protein SQ11_03285 [Nitrosospira sp. NpAV]|nr:hypothetical protein SQ11_03285 [Nitrosospira sp. NpAV]
MLQWNYAEYAVCHGRMHQRDHFSCTHFGADVMNVAERAPAVQEYFSVSRIGDHNLVIMLHFPFMHFFASIGIYKDG